MDETFLEELKKSFDIFGGSKLGYITKSGLRKIFNNIGVQFTTEGFLRIFHMMDLDRDGRIDWEEFKTVMCDWFGKNTEDDCLSGKKRPRDYHHEREHIHKKILKFFLEFKKSPHFEKIRRNLGVLGSDDFDKEKIHGFDLAQDEDDDGPKSHVPKREKRAQFLQWSEQVRLVDVRDSILNAKDEKSIIPGLDVLIQALTSLELFHTPLSRLRIKNYLLNLFETIESVFPKLEQLVKMGRELAPSLQLKICQISTVCLNGPQIAQTPIDHKHHPDKMYMKKMFQSFLPTFVDILENSPFSQLRVQSAMFVANYSMYHTIARDYVLKNFNVVPNIVQLFSGVFQNKNNNQQTIRNPSSSIGGNMNDEDDIDEEEGEDVKMTTSPNRRTFEHTHSQQEESQKQTIVLRKLTWCISIFCGETHPDVPPFEFVKSSLQLLSEMLLYFGSQYDDEIVFQHVLSGLSRLLPGIKETRLHMQFLRLLSHPNQTIVFLVLNTLLKMFRADVFLCAMFMNDDFFLTLLKLLNNPNINQRIKLQVLEVVLIFVRRGNKFAEYVIKMGFVKVIVQMVSSNTSGPFRPRAVQIIEAMSRVNNRADIINNLVHGFGLIPAITTSLEFMIDHHDQIIQRMYGQQQNQQLQSNQNTQQQKVLHYHMTKNIFLVLHNILNVGDTEKQNNSNLRMNPFAQYFDVRTCQRIGTAIGNLRNLRITQKEGKVTLEQHAKTILIRVQREADVANTRDSIQISQLISKILRTFYGDLLTETEAIEHLFREYTKTVLNTEAVLSEKIGMINPDELDDDMDEVSLDISRTISGNVDLLRRKESHVKRKLYMELLGDRSNALKLNQGQLDDLFKWWVGKCSNDGYISKNDFIEGLRSFAKIDDPLVVQSHWELFDQDANGKVDFREFAIGLSMIFSSKKEKQKSSQDNLLRLMFNLYDLNKDGTIDRDEVYAIFKCCREAEGREIDERLLRLEVNKNFEEIDLDGNGQIDFDEFYTAVTNGKLKVGMNISFSQVE